MVGHINLWLFELSNYRTIRSTFDNYKPISTFFLWKAGWAIDLFFKFAQSFWRL